MVDRLFNVLTRHQIYVEGVKAGQSRQFNEVLIELDKELRVLFSKLKFETLDALTKTRLRDFLAKVKKVQSRVYSRYSQKLIDDLKAFMAVDVNINREIFQSVTGRRIEDAYEEGDGFPILGIAPFSGNKSGDERLWSSLLNAPLSANGVLLLTFIATFQNSASSAVENLIRKAYANKFTKEETIRSIIGTKSRNWRDGEFAKIFRQASAVISTVIQHETSIIQAGIGSIFYSRYVWNSVIDNRTTEICIQRNGRIFSFGKGPLPPAHINCRSSIWPLAGNNDVDLINVSYYSWLKSQPSKVQDDILGSGRATKLRDGSLNSKNFSKFSDAKPISVSELNKKRGLILKKD